jgi:excinuclease ABC subunit C
VVIAMMERCCRRSFSSIDDADIIEKWLSAKRCSPVKIIIPKNREMLRLAKENADGFLLHSRTIDRRVIQLGELKTALDLDTLPRRIEAMDISNTGSRAAVGSLVVFENGFPKKSEYRRYRIRTVDGQDDFAMLREVALRRYKRIISEGEKLPDILLVDGGKGQLDAVNDILRRLKIERTRVISIAKRNEEIYTPKRTDPLDFSNAKGALTLLKHARDEAHRFALSYHRKTRASQSISSVLLEIPGIGKKRSMEILRHFGSVELAKNASLVELAKVKGMNNKSAESVKKALEKYIQGFHI